MSDISKKGGQDVGAGKKRAKNMAVSKKKNIVKASDAHVKGKKRYAGRTSYTVPKVLMTSRLRAIGNSIGVILNNHLIEAAGLNAEGDIMIVAGDGVITIQMKLSEVNTDLSTWDRQFKTAIKNGAQPEGDIFENMANEFDLNEW